MSLEQFGYQEQLNRALTTRGLVVYQLVFLFPLIGLIVIGYVFFEMDRSAKIMGACWIAVGIVYSLSR